MNNQQIIKAGDTKQPTASSDQQPNTNLTPYIFRRWPSVVATSVLAAFAGGGTCWLWWSSGKIVDAAASWNFFAQNTLSLFIFCGVVAQALIYISQRKLMHEQWVAMREALIQSEEQTKTAKMAFAIGTQALVCVHSVTLDPERARVFIRIENIGKVPADTIRLKGVLELTEVWDPKSVPVNREYQVLFPGTLKISTRIALHDHFSVEQVGWIRSGAAKFILKGEISYSDGFEPKQTRVSPFAFRYRLGDKEWFVYSGEEEK